MTDFMRILAGPCFMIIGGLMLWIAARLWFTPRDKRVLRLLPFVEQDGLRIIYEMRPTFLAFGLFFSCQGASSLTYWLLTNRNAQHPAVAALGSVTAVFGLWSASLAVSWARRIWLNQ